MEQKTYNTDQMVQEARKQGAVIIDVRSKDMYDQGHIPGAINIPLLDMKTADVKDGSYVYCMTGYHADLAKLELARRGIRVTDMGGMDFYHGPVEK